MTFPDDVARTLADVCAKYPGPVKDDSVFGRVLNETAWAHRFDGWGLSYKDGGRHVDSPVGPIAEDVLHHKPSNLIWDVLTGAGIGQPLNPAPAGAEPIGQQTNPARPWVSPVNPGGVVQPPVDPPVVPPVVEPPHADAAFLAINAKLDRVLEMLDEAKAQQAADTEQIGKWMVEQAQGVITAVVGELGPKIDAIDRCRFPRLRGGGEE